MESSFPWQSVIHVSNLLYSVSSKMTRYEPYSCHSLKKLAQSSTAEYCSKVTDNQMRPFTSTVGNKIYK